MLGSQANTSQMTPRGLGKVPVWVINLGFSSRVGINIKEEEQIPPRCGLLANHTSSRTCWRNEKEFLHVEKHTSLSFSSHIVLELHWNSLHNIANGR